MLFQEHREVLPFWSPIGFLCPSWWAKTLKRVVDQVSKRVNCASRGWTQHPTGSNSSIQGLAWATTPKGILGFQRSLFAPKWSDDDSDSGRRRTLRPSFDCRSSNCARFRENDVNLCQGPRLCASRGSSLNFFMAS